MGSLGVFEGRIPTPGGREEHSSLGIQPWNLKEQAQAQPLDMGQQVASLTSCTAVRTPTRNLKNGIPCLPPPPPPGGELGKGGGVWKVDFKGVFCCMGASLV